MDTDTAKTADNGDKVQAMVRCFHRADDGLKDSLTQVYLGYDRMPQCKHCGFRFKTKEMRDKFQDLCGTPNR